MNPLSDPSYLFPPLLAAGAAIVLAIAVGQRARHHAPHRYFAIFLVGVAAWSFLTFAMRGSPDAAHALAWERLMILAPLACAPLFYFFTRSYTRHRISARTWLPFAMFLGLAALLSLSGHLVTGVSVESYGFAPVFTTWFYLFAGAAYVWIALGIWTLYRATRSSSEYEERNRLLYMLIGSAFPVAGTVIDLFPSVYPASIIGNLVFALTTTIAMRRYRLLDVGLVIRKGAAYIAMSALVATPYVAAIVVVSDLFHGGKTQPVINLVLLVVLALVLQPLWRRVQLAVDRVFFRDRWDSFRALEQFTHRSHSIADLDRPAAELVEIIRSAVGADGVALFAPAQQGGFEAVAFSGRQGVATLHLEESGPIARWLAREQRPLRYGDLDRDPGLRLLRDQVHARFEEARVALLVPLKIRDRISGIVALGPKLAETPYSSQELALLELVAKQTSVLLDDARLYENLASELELGRRRLRAFQEAASKLALEENPNRALQSLVNTMRDLLDVEFAALALYDREGSVRQVVHATVPNTTEDHLARDIRHAGERAESAAVERGGTRVALGLGPSGAEGAFGTLTVCTKMDGKEFTEDDRGILSLFAVLAQVLLENMHLYSEVTDERTTLAAIQASMTDGLLVLNERGRVRYCNEVAAEIAHATPTEVIGLTLSEAFVRSVAQFEPVDAVAQIAAMAEDPEKLPQRLEVRKFSAAPVDISITGFRIPSGNDAGMVGFLFRDTTREREAERRQREFVSLASHELRTPMSTLLGFSELLLHRETDAETTRSWIEVIHRDSQRLTTIIDDMLDIARIQSGKMEARIESLGLGTVVDETVSRAQMSTERHDLQTAIPVDLPRVRADRDKLSQVLTNLLTNAIKYSPKGGTITVCGKSEPFRQRVVVSVADQGLGIAEPDRERLFSTFYRVRNTDTESIRGTGLGLYIVKSMVELMGGEIWVESEVGKGSTFSFSLPVSGEDYPPEPRDTPKTTRSLALQAVGNRGSRQLLKSAAQ